MRFKLLWSIVRVNFRKNWIMILSFFVFLVISLSIFFGLTSYIIGFRNELPSQVFQSQKYRAFYDTWRMSNQIDNPEAVDPIDPTSNENILSDKVINLIKDKINDFNEELNIPKNLGLGIVDKNGQKVDEYDEFINVLMNYNNGMLQHIIDWDYHYFTQKDEQQNVVEYLQKLADFTHDKMHDSNIVAYIMNNYFFNSDLPNNPFKGKVNLGWRSPSNQEVSATFRIKTYMFTKGLDFQQKILDDGIYQTKKYLHQDNVFFVSPNMEKVKHYKLGELVDVKAEDYKTNKIYTNKLTYGGIAAFDETMDVVTDPTTRFVYIANYENKNKEEDFTRKIAAFSNDHFEFSDSNSHRSKNEEIAYWQKIAVSPDGWLNPDNKANDLENRPISLDQHLFVINLIYTAMFSLTIVFDVIMLVLDIVIAWFLIKEIIRSLSKELLFLKTLGMSDEESSLITSVTLLIILGFALCCGLVGMLGIQALFINLTTNFVDLFTKWSSIQPYSLIAIFGAILFLFATYYVVSGVVIRKMKLTDNAVINKSDFRFKRFTNFLFSRNINSGITASFTIKNLNKIIVTFVIMFLISTLSFVALGFQSSVTRNIKQQKNILFNKDNMSWLDSPTYMYERIGAIDKSAGADGSPRTTNKTVTTVEYKNEGLSEKNHFDLTQDNLFDPVQGKFIYRTDLEKWLNEVTSDPLKTILVNQILAENHVDKSIQDIYSAFKVNCYNYDQRVLSLWPKADTNFTINFGALFTKGTYGQDTFQLNNYNNDLYSLDRLIVVKDNDPRVKTLFKGVNETYNPNDGGIPTLPVAVSAKALRNRNLDKGDYSLDRTNIDFQINGYFNVKARMKLHYVSTPQGLQYVGDDYVRQSDFLKWLDYAKNSEDKTNPAPIFTNDEFYSQLKEGLTKDTYYNSFMDNNMPIAFHQMVIPSGMTYYKDHPSYKIFNTFMDFMIQFANTKNFNSNGYDLYKIWRDSNTKLINPLVTTMIVVLVLSLVLVISFIVFMIMTIMSENDNIIFIMKALGYKRFEILWRITSGYLISIVLSVVLGIVIAAVILSALSPTFAQLLFLNLAVTASGSILGLFFALIVVMCVFVVGISSSVIEKRNLTVREE